MRHSRTVTLVKALQQPVLAASLTFAVTLLIMLSHAYASSPGSSNVTAVGNTLCSLAQIGEGNLAQALAIITVMIVGVGATLGKVSWGIAMLVGVGIAVIFNAQNLVNALVTGGTSCSGVG